MREREAMDTRWRGSKRAANEFGARKERWYDKYTSENRGEKSDVTHNKFTAAGGWQLLEFIETQMNRLTSSRAR